MDQTQPRVSMRHLHLYAHLLLAEAKQNGKSVRLEWANIPTASIGPDPANPGGLVLRLSQMAAVGTEEDATRHDELDTCVYLLGDESGSMDEPFDSERAPHLHAAAHKPSAQDQIQAHKVDRKDAAGRVIVAAGEVLDGADIPFGLATYSESVREWKGFEGDWSSTLQRFRPEATGSTNTHLAVVWALRKFIGRSEARKVLTVVTDGDPGDRDILEAALREAAQFGVEVRFVLIGAEHVAKFHGLSATYGVANNVRELATAVFSSLEAAIC